MSCDAWQGCAMPPHLRTIGSSRARNLVLPCVLTPQLTPDPLSILSLLACHPLLTRLSSSPYSLSFTLPLHFPSLCRFHTRPIKFSIHVFFHGVRETGLFTHGRASRNFTIIPMCTPGVAVPCPCGAGQGCAMLLHHRTIGSSRVRNLVVPCVLTPQLPPCAIPHLISTHSPSSPYSLSFTLPTRFPSLSRLTFHPFVVSTPGPLQFYPRFFPWRAC